MIEIRRILCPTDFSDASRHALDYAVAVARWYRSAITVLHVSAVQPVYAFGAAATVVPPALLSPVERERLLASMRASVEIEIGSSVPFATDLVEGPSAAAAIIERAEALRSDLIVLGTHGASGFDRLALGSVTEKVLRKAACPVLTVPPRSPDVVPVPSALFRRILCAVDFSECSMHALTHALSLAQEANAHLLVVNVLEHLLGDEAPPPSPALRGYVESVEADRKMRLAQAVPESAKAFCTVETRFGEGRAHRAILRIAEEDKTDLIVIGVRGRGALDRWMFGSTAQQVVRHATCPVLTLRTAA